MKLNTDLIVERITKEEILKRTTEYDIYNYYMPYKFKLGRVTSSPFREDVHPSFAIFKSNRDGALLFKDFATNQVGDCFKFVSLLFDLNLNQTLEKIWSDIIDKNLKATKQGLYIKEYYKNRKTLISIKRKNFTKIDDKFWGKYNIDRDTLKKYNVFPISKFWVNDIESRFEYSDESPMYAYKVFNSFKIYRPYSELKKDKWRSSCGIYDIQGWEQLPDNGDLLVITKSLKDVMVLSLFNIPSIAPQGENAPIPEKAVYELKKRFKRLVLLYDYDEAGEKGAKDINKQFDIDYVFIPKHYSLADVKDISDHVKEFGVNETKELIKELFYEKEVK